MRLMCGQVVRRTPLQDKAVVTRLGLSSDLRDELTTGLKCGWWPETDGDASCQGLNYVLEDSASKEREKNQRK